MYSSLVAPPVIFLLLFLRTPLLYRQGLFCLLCTLPVWHRSHKLLHLPTIFSMMCVRPTYEAAFAVVTYFSCSVGNTLQLIFIYSGWTLS